ncbi:glycosyltransferase family 4 protein [Pararhizobium sp. IMCC21322]|uniref:glycosyltransferase family 4 protein n=1 Tax=Pararhizobium sp. IMCC21322 TaxID=3067903 RepID=UPI0027420EC1|nr:glycosyltransferase family 4 protein [Pararhizobium sp. IMCC21322]
MKRTTDLTGKTILQIIPRLEAGGAERTTVDIAQAITNAGGRAIVVAEHGGMVSELEAAGGEYIAMKAASKNPVQMVITAFRLQTLIQQNNVDIIHARSRAPAWPALWAARWTRRPFVTTYHGNYNQTNKLKAFYNSAMTRSDVIIANSGMTAALVAERAPAAKQRINKIYRGTDIKAFAPDAVSLERSEALRRKWGLKPADTGRPMILNVARLTGWKGQEVLIDAMAEVLKTSGPDQPLLILAGGSQGDAAYETRLRQTIETRGLSDHIRLVGHCDDVPAALSLATCMVVASTRQEAFGRAAVEAGAAGVPTIATDHGGAKETILAPPDVSEAERTGWRVPPGDADAMAQALQLVLSMRPEARGLIGARAREYVSRHFSLQAMCAQTLEVYSALLSAKKQN